MGKKVVMALSLPSTSIARDGCRYGVECRFLLYSTLRRGRSGGAVRRCAGAVGGSNRDADSHPPTYPASLLYDIVVVVDKDSR